MNNPISAHRPDCQVNYRGSLGFGMDALESLPGRCGTLDVTITTLSAVIVILQSLIIVKTLIIVKALKSVITVITLDI